MSNSNKVVNLAQVKLANENLYIHSLEKSFLASLMFNNQLVDFIPYYLNPDHFGNKNLGEIFKAIKTVVGQGIQANPETVNQALPNEVSKQFGGIPALVSFVDEAIVSDKNTVIHYANTIYDHHKKRELYQLLAESLTSLSTSSENSDELLESHEKRLFKFNQSYKQQVEASTFKDLGREVIRQLSEAYEINKKGETVGLLTGFSEINEHVGGLEASQLYILAGRPAMGKTALATNIAYNVAKGEEGKEGKKVLFFSLEMSGTELVRRILSDISQVNSRDIKKGTVGDVDFGKVDTAYRENSNLELEIKTAADVESISSLSRRKKLYDGLDLIVVDYLQLLVKQGKHDNRNQEVTQITRGLKRIAMELGVPVIALSQLSRKVEDRSDKRPLLSDLRESGSIEQDADVVMFVYRDHYYDDKKDPIKAELIVAKNRHGENRTINLQFDGKFTKFSDL